MSKKLDELLKRKEQLEAQIRDARARKRAEDRKRDTRRKIVIGGAILAAVRDGKIEQIQLDSLLDQYVTSERDRELLRITKPVSQKS
jgi:hypothetical protein